MNDSKEFSFSNMADNFDDHITRSIPSYDVLRDLIYELCKFHVLLRDDKKLPYTILDIGCSQGTMIRRIWECYNEEPNPLKYKCIGVDINEDFKQHWKDETSKKGATLNYHIGNILHEDAKYGLQNPLQNQILQGERLGFAYSLFTTQFLIGEKRKLFNIIRRRLILGGCFVVCEKIKLDTPIKKRQSDLHQIWKHKKGGFSEVEVMQKEQALKNITEYHTEQELLDMLGKTKDGCQFECETIWKTHNFIAIQCIKDDPFPVEMSFKERKKGLKEFKKKMLDAENIINEKKRNILRESLVTQILGNVKGWMKD